MIHIGRNDLPKQLLPGRTIQSAIGRNSAVDSRKMTVGFAHYSAASGPMAPHHHAEEAIYVIDARDGYVRFGDARDRLGERIPLQAGMILHFPELEWHVFEYDEEGYVDIVFIYGQVTRIRPEEMDAEAEGGSAGG